MPLSSVDQLKPPPELLFQMNKAKRAKQNGDFAAHAQSVKDAEIVIGDEAMRSRQKGLDDLEKAENDLIDARAKVEQMRSSNA